MDSILELSIPLLAGGVVLYFSCSDYVHQLQFILAGTVLISCPVCTSYIVFVQLSAHVTAVSATMYIAVRPASVHFRAVLARLYIVV